MLVHVAIVGFLAGAATSVGPCAVPRYLALIGVLSHPSMRSRVEALLLFCTGAIAAYASFALIAGAISAVLRRSDVLQGFLCVGFVVSGVALLTVHTACSREHAPPPTMSRGGPFLAGLMSSCTVAPCCAPVLLGLSAVTASGEAGASTILAVAAFVAGHLTPTWLLGDGIRHVADRLSGSNAVTAFRTVGAACMIALGLYYGVGA